MNDHKKNYTFLFLMCLISVLFSTMLMVRTFRFDAKSGSMEIATKCWSDFGSHIPLIRSFSMGDNLTLVSRLHMPEYPIFSGPPIRYHFVFYMIAGLVEKAGVRIDWALNSLSILSFAGLMMLIFLISINIYSSSVSEKFSPPTGGSNNISIAILSVLFFLFNGSLSFLVFIQKHPLSIHSVRDIVTNTAFPSFGPWDNGLISAFWNLNIYTNQRHLAAGYTIGLLLIGLALYLKNKPLKKQLPFLLLFVPVLSILPMFHQPLLLILGIFFSWYFLVFPSLRIFFLLTGILSAGPVALGILAGGNGTPMVSWHPGYLMTEKVTLLSFSRYWFFNLGLHSILIPLGYILSSKRIKKILFPIFLLFIVANLFQFSKEMAANHKFFNFFLIFGNMLSAYTIIQLYQSRGIHSAFSIFKFQISNFFTYFFLFFLVLFLTLSGIIDLFPVINDRMITLPDIPKNEKAAWFGQSPKDAVVLNSSYLYHPASIAGRFIFLGWPYFPWSAGYPENRMPIMKTMYESKDPDVFCPLMKKYGITLVTVEPVSGDQDLPTIDPSYFRTLAKPVASFANGTYDIYAVKDLCPNIKL